MQFEVEPARVAHRFTRVVSPPQGRCVCAGVATLQTGHQYVRRKKSQERGLLQDENRYLQLAQFMPVLLLPVGAGAVPPDLDLEGGGKNEN